MGKRIEWIDIAKGLAIILVIVGHTVANDSLVRRAIFTFHMPLFFILAGFTFREKDWKPLLVSSVKRLLVPYLLIALSWHVPTFLASGAPLTAGVLAKGLLSLVFASGVDVSRPALPAVGMSWFLMALFTSRILFNGFLKVARRFNLHVGAQAAVCIVAAWLGIKISTVSGFFLPFDLDVCLYTLLLMWIGYMARHLKGDVLDTPVLVFIGVGIVWALCGTFSSLELSSRIVRGFIPATISAVAGTYCVCWISKKIQDARMPAVSSLKKPLLFCGTCSMAIYAIHAVDWMIPWQAMPVLMALPASWFFASIVRCACDIALAYVIKRS